MHTTLPWKQLADEIIGPYGDVIATVAGGEGNRFIDEEDNVECSANMRLLLAAPELLAALELVVSMGTIWRIDPDKSPHTMQLVFDTAKAAIAKVKGDVQENSLSKRTNHGN